MLPFDLDTLSNVTRVMVFHEPYILAAPGEPRKPKMVKVVLLIGEEPIQLGARSYEPVPEYPVETASLRLILRILGKLAGTEFVSSGWIAPQLEEYTRKEFVEFAKMGRKLETNRSRT